MSSWQPKHLTIAGVGLLGGSIGLAAQRAWPGVHVAGVGRRESSLAEALSLGCVNSVHLDPAAAAAESDLVILATPVGAFETILKQIAPVLKPSAIVTDAGSTKQQVVRVGQKRVGPRFVGSHPMAGSEKKGPAHATVDLLADALCVITPTPKTDPAATKRVHRFWKTLGMRTLELTPAGHDRAVASVSHLPHALAAILMLTQRSNELPVAATGLKDTTRLADGDPEMWRDIMTSNTAAVAKSLARFRKQLDTFQAVLGQDDPAAIERYFARAQQKRRDWLKG